MIRKSGLFLFLFMIIVRAYAQELPSMDMRITTTYGDIISGKVKARSLPSVFTLYFDKDSLQIQLNLIRSFRIDRISDNNGNSDSNSTLIRKINRIRYFNNTMVGILSGKSNENSLPEASLSAETINGVIIYRYLALGVGIAYDQYSTVAALPFFISARGDFLDQSFTPFYFVDAGYGPAWDSREEDVNWNFLDVKGGYMLHAGIGCKMYSGSRVHVMIGVGYKVQKTEQWTDEWNGAVRVTERTFKRLSFRMGIGF